MLLGRTLAGPEIYNCTHCESNPAFKDILGHDGPPTRQLWTENLLTGAELIRCPLRVLQLAPRGVADEIQRYVDSYYPAYLDGHLLVSGGWADQPARYVALIREIRRLDQLSEAKHVEITAKDGEE